MALLGFVGTCNANFNLAVIGGNIVWTPVKDLAFTADVNWTQLDQKYSGTISGPGTASLSVAKSAALYELKDQSFVSMLLRGLTDPPAGNCWGFCFVRALRSSTYLPLGEPVRARPFRNRTTK